MEVQTKMGFTGKVYTLWEVTTRVIPWQGENIRVYTRTDYKFIKKLSSVYSKACVQSGCTEVDTTLNIRRSMYKSTGPKMVENPDFDNYIINYGKHRGKTLGTILAEDAGYIWWWIHNIADEQVNKHIINWHGYKKLTSDREASYTEARERLSTVDELPAGMLTVVKITPERFLKPYNDSLAVLSHTLPNGIVLELEFMDFSVQVAFDNRERGYTFAYPKQFGKNKMIKRKEVRFYIIPREAEIIELNNKIFKKQAAEVVFFDIVKTKKTKPTQI